MSEAPAPAESGPLSVEQAIASLTPEPETQEAPEAPVEAAAEPAEIEGEASAPEEPEGEAVEPAEGEEEVAEDEPVVALDPPPYWKQEAKAAFASMTPEQQAVVLAQEGPREEITAKVKAEASAATQQAHAEMQKVTELAEGLAERLPQWIANFETQWGKQEPNWEATLDSLIEQVGEEKAPAELARYQARYNAQRAELQAAAASTAQAQALAQEAFFKAEHAKLAEIAPDLADPETGPAKRTEVSRYLVTQGIAPENIHTISAPEMVIARKAMLYDQAQAALKAKPAQRPASAPARSAPVRPAAAPAQPSSRTAANAAQSRFNLNPSAENAAALLLAKG